MDIVVAGAVALTPVFGGDVVVVDVYIVSDVVAGAVGPDPCVWGRGRWSWRSNIQVSIIYLSFYLSFYASIYLTAYLSICIYKQ